MNTISYSYTEARERLASVWDEAVSTREPILVSRRGCESVVILPVDEWRGVMETAHLLRSPANAQRLLAALQRGSQGKGKKLTVKELAKKTKLHEERKRAHLR